MTDDEARTLHRGDRIKLRMQPSWNGHYPARYTFTVNRVIDRRDEVYVETVDGARLIAWEIEKFESVVNH